MFRFRFRFRVRFRVRVRVKVRFHCILRRSIQERPCKGVSRPTGYDGEVLWFGLISPGMNQEDNEG